MGERPPTQRAEAQTGQSGAVPPPRNPRLLRRPRELGLCPRTSKQGFHLSKTEIHLLHEISSPTIVGRPGVLISLWQPVGPVVLLGKIDSKGPVSPKSLGGGTARG